MTESVLSRAPNALDPIGAAAAWLFAPLLSVVAVGYAVTQSVVHQQEIAHGELMVVAIFLLVGSGVVLSIASHPSVGHLGPAGATFVVGASVLAAVLAGLATWGHNRLVQDDWGQVGIGLIVFGLLWLRPPREIIALGAFGALVVGVMAAGERGSLHIINTPYVYAVVAATPVLVLTAVAATCGAVIVRVSARWLTSARAALDVLQPELLMLEGQSLRRAQLAELRRAALPLLTSIAARGEITEQDIVDAADVSARLRGHAVEELRVTWTDQLLPDVGLPPHVANDPHRLLSRVPDRERAAVTACLVELARTRALDAHTMQISVTRAPNADDSEHSRFEVRAHLTADWRSVRRTARPFISVLRSFGGDAAITRADSTMILRFGFVPA